MNIAVTLVTSWPLRSLGLEPGRSVLNANPTPLQLAKWRADQHDRILEGIARRSDGTRRHLARSS